MKVLDLFCCAGGASMGLSEAWPEAEIVGVDTVAQPNYPFTFVQADAMTFPLSGYDFIWASPPCQRYSTMTRVHENHPDLYDLTRQRLLATSTPWAIENVIGAPYQYGVTLCGSMFGLKVRRHRNFETSFLILLNLPCDHVKQGRPITVTGLGGGKPSKHSWKGNRRDWPEYMQMLWATPDEVRLAIPPAYAKYIAQQLVL